MVLFEGGIQKVPIFFVWDLLSPPKKGTIKI